MKRTSVDADTLDRLPAGSLVEDRFGDRAVRLDCGLWQFAETAPLESSYVSKHYAPLSLIVLAAGDGIDWPEEAMSVPVGTVVAAGGDRYRKAAVGSWEHVTGAEAALSDEELVSSCADLHLV